MAPVDRANIDEILSSLGRCNQDLAPRYNIVVPYLWDTNLKAGSMTGAIGNATVHNFPVAIAVKSCLFFLLLCYPQFLAYICLGLRQNVWAFRTFAWAVRIKEYFLGVDHWLVIGMFELFGSCLLTFHKEHLSQAGENYLREAICRYERSRGRHDELTIAAKMALAHFFTDRGDDKEAERILLEALRDVGKDFDVLAYCALMTEIGKLCRRQNNSSRAKQIAASNIFCLTARPAAASRTA